MYRRILEGSTEEPRGRAYFFVHYWRSRASFDRGEPPRRINDFIIDAGPAEVTQIVRDDRGWLMTRGGTAIDPSDFGSLLGIERWQTEIVTVDRRAFINAVLDAYWWEAEQGRYPRDQSDRRRILRSDRDPTGVLAETRSMVDEGRLVTR